MACVKCDGSDGRNVLAHIVIVERLSFLSVHVDPFDVQEACLAAKALIDSLLVGCEVRYSLTEVADGHKQDSQG